jgi:hypothetical protein
MRLLAAAFGCALAGCGGADADADVGTSAAVRVAGAQFVPGAPPEGQADGPRVRSLASDNSAVFPGLRASALSGSVDLGARSVLIGAQGDTGFWIVPTGVVDALEPTLRTFAATLAFSRALPAGKQPVQVRSVDAAGVVGPPSTFTYQVAAATHDGALVVSLSWDDDADLDLHLTMPNPDPARAGEEPTLEIWPKRPSSFRGSGVDVPKTAAVLDFDSNGQCTIDGRREENVTIADAPPAGHYQVRVDTFALCGQSSARWKITVYRGGEARAAATGVATSWDGYPAQGGNVPFGQDLRPGTAGAGQLAMEFDL